ncbi:uncharacterized protein IL334_000247 [Kwoniella shivajii]|uniref:AttH domain-containing protein n=1 Tax=Kwoniella shivajii TaxID=564305 RepID=A0ABZ1CSU3_9TREE|nr:hypothetical protein IL334_000247 [Kwoniella shivajii]
MLTPKLSLLLAATFSHAKQARNYILPNLLNHSVPLDTTVGNESYDRPFITSHNLTTYEWWYFDAVAADGQSSVVISSLISPTVSGQGTQLLVQVIQLLGKSIRSILQYLIDFLIGYFCHLTVSPQGALFDKVIDYGPSGALYVSALGDGSSGVIGDGDFTWIGKADLSEYTLSLDLPEHNISGTVTLISAAKPFVGCDSFGAAATTDVFWWFNWINLMGDAVAVVDLKVGDQRIAFTGNGYHDKNWGPVPYAPHVGHWYWGHGRAGDYSVVWSRVVTTDNLTKAGGWITRGDEILYSGCVEDDSITVQPFGDNVTIPPNRPNDTQNIEGFHITVDGGENNRFAFTFDQNAYTNEKQGFYARWIGQFFGGKIGEEPCSGVAVTEQMGPFLSRV